MFLSGGVDSSLIQAVVRAPTTYTVQFEEFRNFLDEEFFVSEFAEKCQFESKVIHPKKKDFLDNFESLALHLEFPVGSLSVFPLFTLSRAAEADGFVVALSGEGADELFSGYFRTEMLLREESQVQEYLAGDYKNLAEKYFGSSRWRYARMASRSGHEGAVELSDFFSSYWREEESMLQNMTRIETTVFLQPLLMMLDRMSMANSLEVRNPFLDYRLIDFSATLPDDLKFRNGQGKWILRRALERLLGDELGIVKRSTKHGLPTPVNQWLFSKGAFDRSRWNEMLFGECLTQLLRD